MLSVLRLHLPSEIPIVGCELTPYVLARRPDSSITNDDFPESSPVDGYYLRFRWSLIMSSNLSNITNSMITEYGHFGKDYKKEQNVPREHQNARQQACMIIAAKTRRQTHQRNGQQIPYIKQ
ncbi:hypothetical protein KI387_000184, partial [Taxus chinensis]